MSKKILLFIIIFTIVFLPAVPAENYYADLSIYVDQYGLTTIEGVTNHPDLLTKNTENYTSKKQSYWLLNLTKEEVFSDFVYVINLPQGSSINYVKTTGSFRIEDENGKLILKGFGENEPLSIIIQYQIKKPVQNEFIEPDFVLLTLITVIIILIIVLISLFIKERKTTNETKENNYDFKGLNQRQKQIMKLLVENKAPLTQTEIQKMLNIPKAAVSRNIRRLELKGLIEKEQIGMSNLIRIKKP
ncbi:MAG: winged helix-turn-helix transcriptional regulator [Candidatus Thermoplasmatota archaeon]|jgi:uncharacterized membrane protein|nr:winged helix-turn-helix transcriptional regulator [Candidatus Thermoplasmatota archaeon]